MKSTFVSIIYFFKIIFTSIILFFVSIITALAALLYGITEGLYRLLRFLEFGGGIVLVMVLEVITERNHYGGIQGAILELFKWPNLRGAILLGLTVSASIILAPIVVKLIFLLFLHHEINFDYKEIPIAEPYYVMYNKQKQYVKKIKSYYRCFVKGTDTVKDEMNRYKLNPNYIDIE